MASSSSSPPSYLCVLVIFSLVCQKISGQTSGLSPTFYDQTCPEALSTIRRVVEDAVIQERRMGASLLRLHFHDCFVNGCDGSLLLDTTDTFVSEKNSTGNSNSTRGFEVVDLIKAEVDSICGGAIVSCADVLAVAARDSVVALGGPSWQVQLGRRDSTTASVDQANASLPLSNLNLTGLLENFDRQGLNVTDLVVLSAAHTIGFAQCRIFRNRIYNETNIDPVFASERQAACPREGGDANLAPFDPTPAIFDNAYFTSLVDMRGLLHSDQELFNGSTTGSITDDLVRMYSNDTLAFYRDFSNSMIKMGNLSPLTGTQGQIRSNCRTINADLLSPVTGGSADFSSGLVTAAELRSSGLQDA